IETAQLLDSFIATGRLPAKPIAKQMYSVRSSVRGVRAITPVTRRCGRWPAVLDTSVPGGVTGFWTCVLASCVGSPSPGIQILVVVGVVVVVVVVGMAVHRAAFTFAVHVTLGFELPFRQVSHGHDAARQRRAAALVPRTPLPRVRH